MFWLLLGMFRGVIGKVLLGVLVILADLYLQLGITAGIIDWIQMHVINSITPDWFPKFKVVIE